MIQLKLKVDKSGIVEVYNINGEYVVSCDSVEALSALLKEVITHSAKKGGCVMTDASTDQLITDTICILDRLREVVESPDYEKISGLYIAVNLNKLEMLKQSIYNHIKKADENTKN